MKAINKILLLLVAAMGTVLFFTACEKNDSDGNPSISYVRITDPASSDSLLIGAGQGQLVVIMGSNLQHAVAIWFNDRPAVLTPTYITERSIIVRVPSEIPIDVSNTVKILFKNGSELLYDFEVQISKPLVSSMECEFVNEGDVAVIRGNYFYMPLTVHFQGGVTGDIVGLTDTEIRVRVPAGAMPGQITVKTNFGETISDFLFRDDRPKVIDGDPHEGWWGGYLVTNVTASDPPKISGNYYRMVKEVKAWTWDSPEVAGGPANSMPNHATNVPDNAILKPADYNLKFEVNTVKPYNSNRVMFNVGLNGEDNNAYTWPAPYDSKGKWHTIVVPFEELYNSYSTKPTINPAGYWSRILIFGPGNLDADICFDNVRVVPKKP